MIHIKRINKEKQIHSINIPCTCDCHKPGSCTTHFMPCCNDGRIDLLISESLLKALTNGRNMIIAENEFDEGVLDTFEDYNLKKNAVMYTVFRDENTTTVYKNGKLVEPSNHPLLSIHVRSKLDSGEFQKQINGFLEELNKNNH